MAKNDQFTYRLDYDDSTAYGIHEYGGPASEAVIEGKFTSRFATAYFEEQEDGSILVFRNEDDAANEAPHIGTITRVKAEE